MHWDQITMESNHQIPPTPTICGVLACVWSTCTLYLKHGHIIFLQASAIIIYQQFCREHLLVCQERPPSYHCDPSSDPYQVGNWYFELQSELSTSCCSAPGLQLTGSADWKHHFHPARLVSASLRLEMSLSSDPQLAASHLPYLPGQSLIRRKG